MSQARVKHHPTTEDLCYCVPESVLPLFEGQTRFNIYTERGRLIVAPDTEGEFASPFGFPLIIIAPDTLGDAFDYAGYARAPAAAWDDEAKEYHIYPAEGGA